MQDLRDLVHAHLGDPASGWSAGSFGALAEFSRDADEPVAIEREETGGSVVTARGGLRIVLGDGVRAVAYEGLAAHPDRWTAALALVAPRGSAAGGRSHLAELGRDAGALRPEDRDAVLFDVGVGATHAAFCVRTADAALVATLRRALGENVLAPGHPAMAAIKEASPHRVVTTALARIEVYQPIPSRARGTATPAGPHTHLLPGLLAARRGHSANVPVPRGGAIGVTLHPESPFGEGRPFDARAFAAWEALLARFGPREYVAEKARARAALEAGMPAVAFVPARSRLGRLAVRIARRQHGHLVGPPSAGWRRRFDRGAMRKPPPAH